MQLQNVVMALMVYRFLHMLFIILVIVILKIYLILSVFYLKNLVSAGVLPEDYNFENHKELVAMQPGDVPVTYADTSALEKILDSSRIHLYAKGYGNLLYGIKEFYMTEGK